MKTEVKKPEIETQFENHYYCEDCDCDCDCDWTDTWDSMCDDECPKCGQIYEPYESFEF